MGSRVEGLGASEGPSGEGWREEIARFRGASGRDLVGILTLPSPRPQHLAPSPETQAPAVVVLHGWGTYRSGPHRMLVELCRALAAAGLPALRFDFAGRGDSSGDFWSVGLDEMIADARAAGDWLLQATGAGKLAAAGLCSGANVALGAACGDERFAAVAALSALPFQKQRGARQAAARTGGALRELAGKAFSLETWRRVLRGEVAVGRILRRLLGGEGGRSGKVAVRSPSPEVAGRGKTVTVPNGASLRPTNGKPQNIEYRSQNHEGGGPAPLQARNLKDSSRDIQAELAGYKGRLLFVHGAADAEGLSGWSDVFEPFLMKSEADYRHLAVPGADHDYHDLAGKRAAIGAVVDFLNNRDAQTR